ncbi:MAG: RDD family protein [Sandaracinaceae bacterium]|nr:RDD family protein [Sandaracinaceae bacterium]
MSSYVIRTPENVTFEFELAGLGSRALAWALDVVVMIILLMIASQVVQVVTPVLGGFGAALFFIAVFLIQWWYSALLEWWWGGQTIGKKVVGLRALSADGIRMTFVQAVVRNLVRIVDLLPGLYLVGGGSALLDPHRRRLGDLAAGTIVVRERRALAPSAVVPASERYNTFVDDPAIALAVRKITAPEREAMIGLSLRRERLPLAVRRELFAKLAAHLEERLGVARPSFFSEEKYVLNLTAVAMATGER